MSKVSSKVSFKKNSTPSDRLESELDVLPVGIIFWGKGSKSLDRGITPCPYTSRENKRLAGRDGQTKKDQCFIEKIDNSLRVIVPARSTIPGVVLRVRKMGN